MSNHLTQDEIDELLAEFEKMLEDDDDDCDDFGLYGLPKFPRQEDLEYPDEPPPIPKEVIKELKCDCGTFKTYGKVPVEAHRPYCALRRKKK